MRNLVLGMMTVAAGCDSNYFDASDADTSACTFAAAGIATFALTTPQPIPPVSTDLVLHGTLSPADGITISNLFVAGVPATSDAANFSAFDVTVPLALVQQAAGSGAYETEVMLPVTAANNCSPIPSAIGSIAVELRVATLLSVEIGPTADGYLPSTLAMATPVSVTANPEAAGLLVTATTTAGSLFNSTATLAGDGFGSATATLYFSSMSATPGTAGIIVQTTDAFGSAAIPIVGPPALIPSGGSLVTQTLMTVVVTNTLSGTALFDSIQGCSALAGSGTEVFEGPTNISGSGIVPLVERDSENRPIFHIHTEPGAGSGTTVNVTCIDIYGQVGSASYAVSP